jgi:hypothetical protein
VADAGESPSLPATSARLAAERGHALPATDDVATPEALALVARTRELIAAVVLTDVTPPDRAAIADELAALIARLEAVRRPDEPLLTIRTDGGLEHLTNAGSGRLNPQAPRVDFIDLPPDPPAGRAPAPVEVHARCTFTAAHSGSPQRVHGGLVESVLDQVIGVAATVAGATGLTAEITVRLLAGTPYDVPVDVYARYTRREGRKSWATGEMRVGDTVTAEATALFIAERVPDGG